MSFPLLHLTHVDSSSKSDDLKTNPLGQGPSWKENSFPIFDLSLPFPEIVKDLPRKSPTPSVSGSVSNLDRTWHNLGEKQQDGLKFRRHSPKAMNAKSHEPSD